MEIVYLNNNKLLALPELHWIKHSLIMLHASDNKIKSLDVFNVIGMFELLAYIDMGGNSIRVFNAIIQRYMPKFSNLWLYSNELTSIDDFRIYYKMKIYLVGNPWHCETALSWMGEDDMAFEVGLVCGTPTCVQGIAIADMSKYNKTQDIHKDVQYSILHKQICVGKQLLIFFYMKPKSNYRSRWRETHWHSVSPLGPELIIWILAHCLKIALKHVISNRQLLHS